MPLATVVDIRVLVSELREEALISLATVQWARRAMRGKKVPREVRRAMATAARAAERTQEQARALDELLVATGGDVAGA